VLNGFGWPHLLIIAALIIILFGAKRLPDAARGIGKSMRIFRAETRGMQQEEEAAASTNGAPHQAPPQQLAAPFAPPQSYAQQPQQQYAPPPQQQYTPPAQQPYAAPVADQAPAQQGEQQR